MSNENEHISENDSGNDKIPIIGPRVIKLSRDPDIKELLSKLLNNEINSEEISKLRQLLEDQLETGKANSEYKRDLTLIIAAIKVLEDVMKGGRY